MSVSGIDFDSIESLEKALAREPGRLELRSQLAALERGGEEGPKGMSFFHLGRALLLTREFARAEAISRQGLERFPVRWQLNDILAMALDEQGRTAEALEVYRQAERQPSQWK